MRKTQTFDSGQWNAFFRCSNDLCKAWFPYKVIETFYDESLIKGTEGCHLNTSPSPRDGATSRMPSSA